MNIVCICYHLQLHYLFLFHPFREPTEARGSKARPLSDVQLAARASSVSNSAALSLLILPSLKDV
jgi:hypothetical protein